MIGKCCDRLNDYLDGDLSPLEADEFLQAISDCKSCLAAVNAHREYYSAIRQGWQNVRTPQFDQSANVEASKIRPAENSLRQKSSSRFTVSATLVASISIATVIMLVGVWIWINSNDTADQPRDLANQNGPLPSNGKQRQAPSKAKNQNTSQFPNDTKITKAEIQFSDSQIGVRLDTPDDDFTFIQVYETVNLKPRKPDESNSSNEL